MAISRRRRLLSIFAMFVGMALIATGCAREEPKPTPTPTKTAIFSSEEAALQAAIDVYQEFNAEYDSYMSGENEQKALKPFFTEPYWEEYSQEPSLSDEGIRTEGTTSFFNEALVSYEPAEKPITLSLALCRNLTNVRFYDSSGADVTPKDRVEFVASEITMIWSGSRNQLLINGMDTWDDSSICS